MWPLRRLLNYGFYGGVLVGGVTSLHANQYNVDSIGVVRLGRSAFTVSFSFSTTRPYHKIGLLVLHVACKLSRLYSLNLVYLVLISVNLNTGL